MPAHPYFRGNSNLPDMVESLHQALIDGYNAVLQTGVVDEGCTKLMIGFASASAISLKTVGNFEAAYIFDILSRKLNADWRCFQSAIENAHLQLNKLSK